MKQALGLQLGQQQTIRPQVQQAMRILQLSAQDLRLEVQAALESNPMLDQEEAELEGAVPDGEADSQQDADGSGLELEQVDVIPEELPIDTRWDDVYQAAPPPSQPPSDEDREWPEQAGGESLQDQLRWQLNLSPLQDQDRLIATVIIDAINADGMLTASLEDLAANFDPALGIDDHRVASVLAAVQQFDPPGVGARSLAECLRLQLEQLPERTPWRQAAIALVTAHLRLLASKDFNALARKTRFSKAELAEIAGLIETLNPRPGAAHSAEPTLYVIPDVLVHKHGGRWVVELNPESLPRLRINGGYAALVKRRDRSRDNQFLRDRLGEARWFLKCLESRHETLLRVATKLVEIQQGFFERGESAMRPLVLNDVAEALDLHPTTVSRATSRKYMHCPRGLFELKYFFSNRVGAEAGEELSGTAIRALIKSLTEKEDPKKPLSDNGIAAILADRNIKVARRTVAKYRESLAIPPSKQRRRLA